MALVYWNNSISLDSFKNWLETMGRTQCKTRQFLDETALNWLLWSFHNYKTGNHSNYYNYTEELFFMPADIFTCVMLVGARKNSKMGENRKHNRHNAWTTEPSSKNVHVKFQRNICSTEHSKLPTRRYHYYVFSSWSVDARCSRIFPGSVGWSLASSHVRD